MNKIADKFEKFLQSKIEQTKKAQEIVDRIKKREQEIAERKNKLSQLREKLQQLPPKQRREILEKQLKQNKQQNLSGQATTTTSSPSTKRKYTKEEIIKMHEAIGGKYVQKTGAILMPLSKKQGEAMRRNKQQPESGDQD